MGQMAIPIQSSQVQAETNARWWPPHPRNQVQLAALDQNVIIPAWGELEIYQVPTDRWLVIVPPSGGGLPSATNFNSAPRLVEDLGGVMTLKSETSLGALVASPGDGPLGWTFAPGSRVLLQDVSGGNLVGRYSFFGYLTRL